MAVQTRRGNEADFQPNKMTAGETATLLDTKKVYHTFAPGDCRRLATHEEMTEMIDESIEGIKQDFTADLTQAITDSETATATAIASAQNADDKALLADEAGDRANTAAENAEAVVLGDIATDTTVGVVKGGGDVTVEIDGTMSVSEASNANVTVVESAEDGEITTGLLGAILGLIKKKFSVMLTSLARKIDKTSIVQSTEISDATKVPSSVVTASQATQIGNLSTSITTLNNNLAGTMYLGKGLFGIAQGETQLTIVGTQFPIPLNTDKYMSLVKTTITVADIPYTEDVTCNNIVMSAYVLPAGTRGIPFINLSGFNGLTAGKAYIIQTDDIIKIEQIAI